MLIENLDGTLNMLILVLDVKSWFGNILSVNSSSLSYEFSLLTLSKYFIKAVDTKIFLFPYVSVASAWNKYRLDYIDLKAACPLKEQWNVHPLVAQILEGPVEVNWNF